MDTAKRWWNAWFHGSSPRDVVIFFSVVVAVIVVVVLLAQNPQSDDHTTQTRTTVGSSVSSDSEKACAAEAISEFPGDQQQQQFAYRLCLNLQTNYDSQQSDLINGGN